jgi:serine/threonine-protein kinase
VLERLRRGLGEQYDVEGELGAGMSRVFLATERALGRRVVLKVLSPELAGDVAAERFRREIQLVATLQHPHIVPLLTTGLCEGVPYFVMPYVEGKSLRARLACGPLELREAFTLFRDVLKALAYAHGRGVVHRDIKPENIMFSGGVAVVTDFGVAKALQAAQHDRISQSRVSMGMAIGTPGYMSPEQAAADPAVDHRADLYALGVVAWEALAGRHPFEGQRGALLMAAHATCPVPPLKPHAPGVPRALRHVIERAMAKDPADRPQSAEEVLQVLESFTTPRTSAVVSGALDSGGFHAPPPLGAPGEALPAAASVRDAPAGWRRWWPLAAVVVAIATVLAVLLLR